MKRVQVVGTSGSGKTTTGRLLAERLGVQHIELDALHHGPNWAEPTAEEFRTRVEAAIGSAPDGWVIDGGYGSKLGTLVAEQADLPLHVCLRRLWRRTWGRIIRREELWSGNRESIRNAFFIKDSLFSWTIRRHRPGRKLIRERIARNPHVNVVHLRSQREVDQFLQSDFDGDVQRTLG